MVGSDSTRTELIDVEFPDPEQLCVFVKTGMLHDDDETALGIKSETAGLKRARGGRRTCEYRGDPVHGLPGPGRLVRRNLSQKTKQLSNDRFSSTMPFPWEIP